MGKFLGTGQTVVAIDIGTTKICVIVGRKVDGLLEVAGMGTVPSHGLKKGVVVDVAKAVESIKAAVKEAEIVAGCTIEAATVGVSGSHIQSMNSHGAVPIRKGGEVKEFDIENVTNAAKAVQISEDQQILHALPKYFRIDGQEKIHNPLGMHGVRLEAEMHIILGSVSSVQNIVRCCELAGVQVVDVVLEQLASAEAVLNADERELGVGILDIGGGTADLAVYQNGTIRHTMVIPIAGNHFTHDVAVGLQTTLGCAEQIKQNYGLASADLLEVDNDIEVEKIEGGKKDVMKQSYLVHIIQSRAAELLEMIDSEIKEHDLQSFLTTGLVFTGGGSLLTGIDELAKITLCMPARVGIPRKGDIGAGYLSSPIYATGYGLLLHAVRKNGRGMQYLDGPVMKRVFYRMKSWVSEFF